jgi:glycosyltransferase involved in cell wall biosynthesis
VRVLLIHQNLPGQYRHLLAHLGAQSGVEVVGLGEMKRLQANVLRPVSGVRFVGYQMPAQTTNQTPRLLPTTEDAVIRGRAVLAALLRLKRQGFIPDVVYAHPGWGETLFLRDVFPGIRLLSYCEFYYNGSGQDFGFDPEFPVTYSDVLAVRVQNMHHLMALESADVGISPTLWQKSRFPQIYWPRIDVVHDGIDSELVRPDTDASITLGSGTVLRAGDEILTYVARNLEPYRGFHAFMRALPEILAARPSARVVVVGGDDVSYGKRLSGQTYRQLYVDEIRGRVDLSRVHFLGRLAYRDFLRVLQVSRTHVYLTYPFVLSWSLMEAMSCECLIVGSDTAPVREVIRDGSNGFLVDFFDRRALIERVVDCLASPGRNDDLRRRARADVISSFDLRKVCLPRQHDLIFGSPF